MYTLKVLSLLICCMALLGCGGDDNKPLAMATNPEKAKLALQEVMDAWKAGKTRDDLKRKSPPHYLQDDDFYSGKKLTNYRIDGDGSVRGIGMTFTVELTIQDSKSKKVGYRVVTEPNVAITREDGSP